MIMRRMGAVTPPPVVAEPAPTPADATPLAPVPDLPASSAPLILPGSPVTVPKPPGKPGGRGGGAGDGRLTPGQ